MEGEFSFCSRYLYLTIALWRGGKDRGEEEGRVGGEKEMGGGISFCVLLSLPLLSFPTSIAHWRGGKDTASEEGRPGRDRHGGRILFLLSVSLSDYRSSERRERQRRRGGQRGGRDLLLCSSFSPSALLPYPSLLERWSSTETQMYAVCVALTFVTHLGRAIARVIPLCRILITIRQRHVGHLARG